MGETIFVVTIHSRISHHWTHVMKTLIASGIAAAVLVSAASADVTYTLTNATFGGWNFIEAYAGGTLTGTLTGASIDVMLNANLIYTTASDLCVYVAPSAGDGLLQCGGSADLGGTQRYYWPNGDSNSPGTTSIGTVNFTTGINMATNPTQIIWIGNGFRNPFYDVSGTWTGTITLIGVTAAVPAPGAMALLGLAGFCSRRRRA
jgi:MYXO-CTERM domain-containing protein